MSYIVLHFILFEQVSPYLGGIGISSAVVSYIVALYYNTIIAWCLIYLLHSFESPLPWAECPKRLYSNFTYDIEPECVVSSPTQYYWYRSTLQSSPSVDVPEAFNYNVAIALLTAWFLVYICMVQGITSSGKIVYITAIFPYVVLIIFFFRGITLKGLFHKVILQHFYNFIIHITFRSFWWYRAFVYTTLVSALRSRRLVRGWYTDFLLVGSSFRWSYRF